MLVREPELMLYKTIIDRLDKIVQITKHFRPDFKETLVLVKTRLWKYRLRLNIIEHQ